MVHRYEGANQPRGMEDILMNETGKHTPGPWEVWQGTLKGTFTIVRGIAHEGRAQLPTLAQVHNYPGETEANARLIAAAPDLLEAAELALVCIHEGTDKKSYDFVRAAIARAEEN